MSRTPVSYSRKEFISSYKKKYPDSEISRGAIEVVIDNMGIAIADILLEDGEIKLGNRLGTLMIRKHRPKGKGGSFTTVINEAETIRTGKTVYQFNDHSEGFVYRFLWNKAECKSISDKNMWIFKAIRNMKRKLAPLIKGKKHDYPIMIEAPKQRML